MQFANSVWEEYIRRVRLSSWKVVQMQTVGIIGLDTSHAVQFTRSLNQPSPPADFAGFRVTVAVPEGSREIESSRSRIPGYTEELRRMGVEMLTDVSELAARVDAVLLETNDGRLHLEQVLPVLKAGKPVFVDKPIAASLPDVFTIYHLAERYGVPLFSSSALRFLPELGSIQRGELGDVLGCETYSPCPLEPTHTDLFWYGIHGVELLCTVMGSGCERVSRMHSAHCDFVTGMWADGRIGSFRGRRDRQGNYFSGFGGTVYGSLGIRNVGRFLGYELLLKEICRFFRTGEPPVSASATLEIYTFMEAADESRRRAGAPVTLQEIRDQVEQGT